VCRDTAEQGQVLLGQQVGGDLEVKVAPPVVLQDERPDQVGPPGVVVEGAVHQLDVPHLPLHQEQQVALDTFHRIGAHRPLHRGEAEGAVERAAAGGLVVDQGLCEIDQAGGEG
jgi:hypothetical protein